KVGLAGANATGPVPVVTGTDIRAANASEAAEPVKRPSDRAGQDGGRQDCPVLPCLPHTAINADRLDQGGLAGPSDTDAGQSRRLAAALIVISTAQLMVVLDATIVTVALPSMRRALHFSTVDLQWVISAYTLAFGGLLLLKIFKSDPTRQQSEGPAVSSDAVRLHESRCRGCRSPWSHRWQ